MTYREYIEENAADILAELCQYQSCDNCSLGNHEKCALHNLSPEEALDEKMDED